MYGYENRTSEGDETSQQQRQRSFTIYEDMNNSGFVASRKTMTEPEEPIYQVPSSLLTISSSSFGGTNWRDRDVVRF